MVNELLELYKTKLTLRKIVIKNMKLSNLKKSIVSLLICLFLIVISFVFISNEFNYAPLGLLFLWAYIFIKETDVEIKRIQREQNQGKNYYQIRIQHLKTYLKNEGIDHDQTKLKLLIEMVDKQAEEFIIPFLIGRGLFLSFFIPLWSALITYTLNRHIERLELAVVIVVVASFIIMVIWLFSSMLKQIIYDEIINGDYQRLKAISNDIREIHFKG